MNAITNPEARQWASFCHFAAFAGYVVPMGGVLGPLIVWQMKKDQFPEIDEHGKESLNFQISMLIYSVVSLVLVLVLVGILMLIALAIIDVVYVIMAGIAAGEGRPYRYPMTIRLVK